MQKIKSAALALPALLLAGCAAALPAENTATIETAAAAAPQTLKFTLQPRWPRRHRLRGGAGRCADADRRSRVGRPAADRPRAGRQSAGCDERYTAGRRCRPRRYYRERQCLPWAQPVRLLARADVLTPAGRRRCGGPADRKLRSGATLSRRSPPGWPSRRPPR